MDIEMTGLSIKGEDPHREIFELHLKVFFYQYSLKFFQLPTTQSHSYYGNECD